ncbi:MAG: tRNA (adenosine(37)-N6)-threonylcarbamoyltransferase complex ATPase subunit type 1 TsaE [Rickettsiaceae bacterium]|nr:tRNA (adenosine(37)-N6)-threonylcarbamoyltransferase complex ATPase subunit type 1 TsaE [Rickettsiaceae bacterium]
MGKKISNFIINSENDINLFVTNIIDDIKKTKLVLLSGDLGAGKTTLAKEIVFQLIGYQKVLSPTFTIVNQYINDNVSIFHYDLYRLECEDELFNLSLEEDIEQGYVLIEWPNIATRLLRKYEYLNIHIELQGNKRYISLSST